MLPIFIELGSIPYSTVITLTLEVGSSIHLKVRLYLLLLILTINIDVSDEEMDTDNRKKESGEQFNDAASEAEMESRCGRGSIPGTTAELNARAHPTIRCKLEHGKTAEKSRRGLSK